MNTSNLSFNWFLKILSLMNNGSTLLGWDDSPMNVMGTLVSRLELGSLEINLGMAWAKS